MPAPKEIERLIRQFTTNFDFHQSKDYYEEDLRHEFLKPLFQELDWDLENDAGKGINRDVRYEKVIDSGAPDYGFYLDGILQFYVEAKRPSEKVCKDTDHAYQLRSYGYSAKIPLCILTDFEELAIYDTTIRPEFGDRATVARLKCIQYKDLPDEWADIVSLFSRGAVLAGSLEKRQEQTKQAVDDDLLEDVMKWRVLLAVDIAERNFAVTEEKLREAVQTIIDRILFLRICEDRRIELRGTLQGVAESTDPWPALVAVFKKASIKYDSGVFRIGPECELALDSKILVTIISSLYYPNSPYAFQVISADILGKVYEQFLGWVIRLDSEHRALIEEKPEVVRAGGVYYTPQYIVRYLVENTVGRKINGKSPKEIETLSIIDPACGSGSFLIGAFQYLIDWSRDWYVDDGAEKNEKAGKIWLDKTGIWQLSLMSRKELLTRHIFGVDIDHQAVEVAKLSLLLKALEAPEQPKLVGERILPELDQNIACGNSIIGTDFSAKEGVTDLATLAAVNAFDWSSQFPDIFTRGGFDIVIGNPPYANYSARDSMRAFYVREKMVFELEVLERTISYCSKKYPEVSAGVIDLYKWFTLKAIRLTTQKGILGYIIPDTWITLTKYKDLRSILSASGAVEIIDLGFGVFDVTVPTCLLISDKIGKQGIIYADLRNDSERQATLRAQISFAAFDNYRLGSSPFIKKYYLDWPDELRLVHFVTMREGLHIQRKQLQTEKSNGSLPIIDSKNMDRYSFRWLPRYYFENGEEESFRTSRGPRLIIRKTGDHIVATVTPEDESFVLQSLYQSVKLENGVNPYFILGIMNSKFMSFIYQNSEFGQKGRIMAQFRKAGLDRMPMPQKNEELEAQIIDESKKLIELVSLKPNSDAEAEVANRQIEAAEKAINTLVYNIYGLTDPEIETVEAG